MLSMNRSLLFIILIITSMGWLVSCSSRINCNLRLHQTVKDRHTDTYIITPVNNPIPSFDTVCSHITYNIGTCHNKIVLISTSDPNFIFDKMKVGQPLSKKYARHEIKTVKGWGRYVRLDNGWYAGESFPKDENKNNEEFIIDFFFKYDFLCK